jgi:hypothetical protein
VAAGEGKRFGEERKSLNRGILGSSGIQTGSRNVKSTFIGWRSHKR